MSFTNILAAGTAAADGTVIDCTDGRSPLIFQVDGAALTVADTIQIQYRNLTGTFIPAGTLSATVQRIRIDGPGVFRASRTAIIATSSGVEYDAMPVI